MADDQPTYRFSARLWLYSGQAGWHFLTLPHDVADQIDHSDATRTAQIGLDHADAAQENEDRHITAV